MAWIPKTTWAAGQDVTSADLNRIEQGVTDAQPLAGTLATRPAANAVATNSLYYATDTGLLYETNGTTWTTVMLGGGQELGYAEKTDAAFAPAVGGRLDITNLPTISFTVAAGQIVMVELLCTWVTAALVGAFGTMYISDNAGADAVAVVRSVGQTSQCYVSTAGTRLGECLVRERITTPGSYVRKGQAQSTTGVVTFQAGTGVSGIPPISLRAIAMR